MQIDVAEYHIYRHIDQCKKDDHVIDEVIDPIVIELRDDSDNSSTAAAAKSFEIQVKSRGVLAMYIFTCKINVLKQSKNAAN